MHGECEEWLPQMLAQVVLDCTGYSLCVPFKLIREVYLVYLPLLYTFLYKLVGFGDHPRLPVQPFLVQTCGRGISMQSEHLAQ